MDRNNSILLFWGWFVCHKIYIRNFCLHWTKVCELAKGIRGALKLKRHQRSTPHLALAPGDHLSYIWQLCLHWTKQAIIKYINIYIYIYINNKTLSICAYLMWQPQLDKMKLAGEISQWHKSELSMQSTTHRY